MQAFVSVTKNVHSFFLLVIHRIRWEESLSLPISNDDIVHVTPSAGGPTLATMLNILRGYNFTSKSIESDEESIHTYHRIIEAFKFGMFCIENTITLEFAEVVNRFRLIFCSFRISFSNEQFLIDRGKYAGKN